MKPFKTVKCPTHGHSVNVTPKEAKKLVEKGWAIVKTEKAKAEKKSAPKKPNTKTKKNEPSTEEAPTELNLLDRNQLFAMAKKRGLDITNKVTKPELLELLKEDD